MIFPLELWDLSLWSAIAAIILLITSEMISPYHARINLYINRKRLRNVAVGVSVFFLGTIIVRIVYIILGQ